jgi:hypothetical protein
VHAYVVHMCVCMYACMCVCMYACMLIYTYIYVHTHAISLSAHKALKNALKAMPAVCQYRFPATPPMCVCMYMYTYTRHISIHIHNGIRSSIANKHRKPSIVSMSFPCMKTNECVYTHTHTESTHAAKEQCQCYLLGRSLNYSVQASCNKVYPEAFGYMLPVTSLRFSACRMPDMRRGSDDCVCIYVCMYLYIYMFVRTIIYKYIYTYTIVQYIHIRMYSCVHTYIYISHLVSRDG